MAVLDGPMPRCRSAEPATTKAYPAAETRLQEDIQQLADGYVPGESDPTRLRDDLERLASDLEAHFAYEEQTIVTALNAIVAAPTVD
jgi:hypothetical protein